MESDLYMDISDELIKKKAGELRVEIEEFRNTYRFRQNRNYWISVGITIAALISGGAASAAGFMGHAQAAGIAAFLVTFFIGIDRAFSLKERTDFQRQLFVEADNLLDDVKFNIKDEKSFGEILLVFKALRSHSANNLPTGSGIEVVRDLASAIRKKPNKVNERGPE